jgi:hypothetical protein
MIRKVILASVTGVGLALPFAFATPAEAHPPVVVYHRATFEVVYRRHSHWHCYGTYFNRYEADRAARHLAHHGYEVRVTAR